MPFETRSARAAVAIVGIVLASCGERATDVSDAGGGSDAPPGWSDVTTSNDVTTGSNDAPGDSLTGPSDAARDVTVPSTDAMRDAIPPPSDADAAVRPSDASRDLPLVDITCDDSGRPRDVASGATMPDPDDPSCFVPAPEPLACLAHCAPVLSPVYQCQRSQATLGISGAYGWLPPRADAQGIYWVANGRLVMQRIGAASGAADDLAYVGNESYVVDDNDVYFGSPSDSGQVTLTRMKRDRTNRLALAEVKPASSYALDKTTIYFNRADGKVASLPKSGGTPVEMGVGDLDASALQVDDTHLYWVAANGAENDIKRMAKGTPAIETFASGLGRITWMQQQGESLLLFARNAFLSLPKAGGCARVLAVPAPDPGFPLQSIAADEDAIYWMTVFTNSDSPMYRLWRTPRWGGAVVSVIGTGISQPGRLFMAIGPSVVVLKLDGTLYKVERQ